MYIPDSLIDVYGARIGPYGIAVYCCLASQADAHGQAVQALEDMAQWLGISSRSVLRALETLQRHGLVIQQHGRYRNLYTLTLTHSHSDSQSLCPTVTLTHSHSDMHFPLTGNGAEISSLVPTVPGFSPVPDPKNSQILNTHKEGECRGGKTPPKAGPLFTSMPEDPEIQEAMKQSIISQETWQPWLVSRQLTHMDIDAQWDDFVIAAIARHYRYSNWYRGFQKWLTSKYQAAPPRYGSAPGMTYTQEETDRILDEDEASRRATL
jgi:biotin operon repressor